MPAMPAANHFTVLHDPFAEGKSKVGAQIFNREDTIIPTEQRDVQTFDFYGVSEAFGRKLREACHTHPLASQMSLTHHRYRPNVILLGHFVGEKGY